VLLKNGCSFLWSGSGVVGKLGHVDQVVACCCKHGEFLTRGNIVEAPLMLSLKDKKA
jgi:hypothetical protein